MRMLLIAILVFGAVGGNSCNTAGRSGETVSLAKKRTKPPGTDPHVADAVSVPDLRPEQLASPGIVFRGTFDSSFSLLHALIPGAVRRTPYLSSGVIDWSCSTCPRQNFWNAYKERNDSSFPFPKVTTQVSGSQTIQILDKKYWFLSFESYPWARDEASLFAAEEKAVLGVARFKKRGKFWILDGASPAVGIYRPRPGCDLMPGPTPNPLSWNQFGFFQWHCRSLGVNGRGYMESLHCIAERSWVYRDVGNIPCMGISSDNQHLSNWQSTYSFSIRKHGFWKLIVKTEGHYAPDSAAPVYVPQGISAPFAHAPSCDFILKTQYAYHQSRGYVLDRIVSVKMK